MNRNEAAQIHGDAEELTVMQRKIGARIQMRQFNETESFPCLVPGCRYTSNDYGQWAHHQYMKHGHDATPNDGRQREIPVNWRGRDGEES